ncbi:hypothetical protein BGX26_009841 [Mortierella sp. AD094]|nr:hypothetical protein BGX26_009841 [Mortierella sp. AD094]
MSSTASSPVESTFSNAMPSPSAISTCSTTTTSSYFPTPNVKNLATTTVAELAVAEAHYLSALKRVGNALNLSSNQSVAQGRKSSNTVRALVERWTSMMLLHVKFHDDIVGVKEDVRSATKLLNGLLVSLEPLLADHGHDLSNAVYKLGRNDKRSGHKQSEWDVALRSPFDHLIIYNEWLQRIDPQGKFNRECLAQLNSLVLNVKSVIETNQNPRGMLKRISTLARNVIRRPPSGQLLNNNVSGAGASLGGLGQIYEPSPASPVMTMVSPIINTAITVTTTTTEYTYVNSPTENMIETVTDQVSALSIREQSAKSNDNLKSRGSSNRFLNRNSVARSDVSSVGSLTLAASSESLHTKSISYNGRPDYGRQLSAASQRQLFIEERESRKATLRAGTNSLIAAKADSLQNQGLHYRKSLELERLQKLQSKSSMSSMTSERRRPTGDFVSRPSIDRLRTITKREPETKPPVKSLISFWEQTTPIEV